MATNQSHVQHLNRPAAVIFKKPLATNEEMTAELEKLLTTSSPMVQKTIRSIIDTNKYKALFVSPSLNKHHLVGYNQNLMFNRYACEITKNGTTSVNNDYQNKEIANNSLKLKYRTNKYINNVTRKIYNFAIEHPKITGVLSSLILPGGINLSPAIKNFASIYADNLKKSSSSDLVITSTDTNSEKDTDLYKRTWYVAVFDDDYYIPETNYSSIGLNNNGTSSSYNISFTESTTESNAININYLNSNVIFSTEKIKIGEFNDNSNIADTSWYKKVITNNKPVSFYKIILQSGADYNNPTLVTKDAMKRKLDAYIGKDKFKYSKINSRINSQLNKFILGFNESGKKDGTSSNLIPVINLDNYKKLTVKSNKASTYYIRVDNAFSSYSGFEDYMQKIASVSNYYVPNNISAVLTSNTKSVEYRFEGGYGYLYFLEGATLYDLATAYFLMCTDHNNNINKISDESVESYNIYGSEFPLRYVNQSTYSGMSNISKNISTSVATQQGSLNTSNTKIYGNSTFNHVLQLKAMLDSYGSGRVSKKLLESNITSRNIDLTQLTIRDFKLIYYTLIKYNVVIPKYNKLYSDFINNKKSSTVKMFPNDFFKLEDSLSEDIITIDMDILENIPNQYDLIRELTYILEKQALVEKDELIKKYEDIYYGGWSGFYYSSSTPNNESIKKYTNTKIYDDTLTDILSIRGNTGTYIIDNLYLESLNNISNTDVASISISRQTMGKSSASIIINSIDEKYTYKSGIYFGESLFEPMDEVMIYLPTYDGKIELAFKGNITSAESVNNNGYHNMVVTCECPLKLLDIVRTNIKPSYDFSESEYKSVHPFTVPKDMMNSVDKWMPFILIQGLSYFTSMLGSNNHNKLVYTISSTNVKNGSDIVNIDNPVFNDILLTYLWYRKSNHTEDISRSQEAFKNLIELYCFSQLYKNESKLDNYDIEPGLVDLSTLFSENNLKNKRDYKKVDYIIYSTRMDNDLYDSRREVVATITGTSQPAFALGFNDINLTFSNYKTNFSILKETAEKFNFFIYTDRFGIVRFAPPMISLTNLSLNDSGSVDINRVIPISKEDGEYHTSHTDYSYYYSSPNILNKQTTISLRESKDDSKLVNWMQLTGSFVESTDINSINAGNAVTIKNIPSMIKYGVHSQSEQSILGIKTKEALLAYGTALMDRNSKNFMSATAECIGTGDIDINKTVYNAISNTIYIRTGLILNYTAGSSFTSKSTLNWGRKPLCEVERDTSNNEVDLLSTLSSVKNLSSSNHITYSFFKQVSSLLNYLLDNTNVFDSASINTSTSSFIFNGYCWNGLASLIFEDLSTEYYNESVKSGLQTSVFSLIKSSSRLVNYKDAINAYKLKEAFKRNDTEAPLGVFISPTTTFMKELFNNNSTDIVHNPY